MNKKLVALTIAALIVAFAATYALEAFAGVKISFNPPYYYASGDAFGVVNAFAFAFVFSLLFFGYGAPIAMLIEGIKYGSFLANGSAGAIDAAFALPALLAGLAGVALGQGALREWRGTGSFFEDWGAATRFFAAGAVLLGVLLVIKNFV